MAASTGDKITDVRNAARPVSTTVSAPRSSGGSSLSCASLTGWPTASNSKVHFVTYKLDSSSAIIAGSQLDCYGIVSGSSIGSFTVVDGTDTGHAIGDVVEMLPTAAWAQDLADALTAQHSRTGSHTVITGTSLNVTSAVSTDTVSEHTVATGVTVDGLLIKDSALATNNSVPALALATNAITLDYVEKTDNFSTSSATAVQVTGLTSTVTIPAGGRKVKITAYFRDVTNTAGVTSVYASIWDGTVGSGTQLVDGAIGATLAVANYFTGGSVMAVHTPSAGSKTYNVGLRSTAANAITAENSATARAFLLIEAI